MAICLDTSALAKLYHQEAGSTVVEELLTKVDAIFVARLGILEMHSVLSGKVRSKELTEAASELARRMFRSEVRKRRVKVVPLLVRHYEHAETLIATYGTRQGLRALDSLQLAVALDLQRNNLIDSFVTADKLLCAVAPLEGLAVIDPTLRV